MGWVKTRNEFLHNPDAGCLVLLMLSIVFYFTQQKQTSSILPLQAAKASKHPQSPGLAKHHMLKNQEPDRININLFLLI